MLGKAVLVLTLLAATPLLVPAETAEMALCRPYAAQLSQFMVKYIWLRAYSNCIADENDKPPQLPTDWQSALEKVMPPTEIGVVDEPATPEITPAELDKIGVVPATDDPTPPPKKSKKKIKADPKPDEVQTASVAKGTGRSGFAKGTKEWNAYCKRYWPASFDQKTGTIIRRKNHKIPCPA